MGLIPGTKGHVVRLVTSVILAIPVLDHGDLLIRVFLPWIT